MREIQILVVSKDRAPVDITAGVQALHNLLAESMDWGSEFFTIEDLVPIRALEKACGWETAEYGLDQCQYCEHPRQVHTILAEHLCRMGRGWSVSEQRYSEENRCKCPGFEIREERELVTT